MGLREKALSLGATDFGESKVKGKKYYVIYNGRRINFGASGYSDYTKHKDEDRRENYRARHQAIKTKDGKPAYLNKNQPAYWAYHLLW